MDSSQDRVKFDRNDFPLSFGREGRGQPKKKPNLSALSQKDHAHIRKEVDIHCGKVFHFADDPNYILPGIRKENKNLFSSDKWVIHELLDLKSKLNNVKSMLNKVDLEKWHEHTGRVNYAANVMRDVKKFGPELLTQAWCKFYDIASNFNLFPDSPNCKRINSLHLCEAPGAFIASLNHYLRSNLPEAEWKWLANTLNPYYEGNDTHQMIVDDRFLLKTLDRWCFGEDATGDIRESGNVDRIIEEASKMGPVHLVTADGSVDCLDDPAEQENRVVSLHYYEVLVALRVLEKGGSFVLKLFTLFECDTICLVYFLRCCFHRLVARKPVPSKEGNSEIYLICLEYKGLDFSSDVLKSLDKMYSHEEFPSNALFSRNDIPTKFIENVLQCARFFTNTQISVILRNISLYSQFSIRDRLIIDTIQKKVVKKFFETCKLEFLKPEQYVGKQKNYAKSINFTLRENSGSFEERTMLKNSSLSQVIENYKKKLACISDDPSTDVKAKWLSLNWIDSDSKLVWRASKGKRFRAVKSSPFCPAKLIEMLGSLWNFIGKDTSVAVPPSTYDGLAAYLSIGNDERVVQCIMTPDEYIEAILVDYCRFQTLFLDKLQTAVNKLRPHDTLILGGVPLLTQYFVALVYLLAQFFTETSLADPRCYDSCVIFSKLSQQGLPQLLSDIREESNSSPTLSTLSLIPIRKLRSPEILIPVSQLNAEVLKKVSSRIIVTLERMV